LVYNLRKPVISFEEHESYWYEQALVSLKLKKTVDAGVGRTFAVRIEGG